MKTAWIDAQIGIAGDMLLAALVDAGARESKVRESVRHVLGPEVQLSFSPVNRSGMRAMRLNVSLLTSPPGRHLSQIRQIIGEADLAPQVSENALKVFNLVAEAEAKVHGVHANDIHFHELGAWDSLADVIGTCAAWHDLGIEEGYTSRISVGSGIARSEHGAMPVPVPCVAEILSQTHAPATAGPLTFEACTPTGAALACVLAGRWRPLPLMSVSSIGVGAGACDPPGVANITRVMVGQDESDLNHPVFPRGNWDDAVLEHVTELSTNIDDMEPRLWPRVLDELLAAGALDAWLTPILMKKGRPAHALRVLCQESTIHEVMTTLFNQTTTLGVRIRSMDRIALNRSVSVVKLGGVDIRVKVGMLGQQCVTAQPEWQDVEHAAASLGLPHLEIIAAALETWRSNQLSSPG